MKILTLDQLKALAKQTSNPSISIFLPTHRTGQDTRQDPIRFKNLLREAEKQMLDNGSSPRDVSAILQHAQVLQNDTDFWNHQYDGLVVFFSLDDFHFYHLPFSVEELLVISETYFIKPVLPLFSNNGHYFILALSQNEIRLFEGTRYSVGQIDLPQGIPESLETALQMDSPQKQLQMHTAQRGTGHSMFHGQGPGEEEQKVLIEQYLNLVDTGLKELLNEQKAPLVLAGVDFLQPIYRKVSEYAHIMQAGISGNPEHLRPEELQKLAWPIVEAFFGTETEKAVKQYQELAGTDTASDKVDEVVAAAFNGRVEKLIVSVEAQVWGAFDHKTGLVTHSSEGQDKHNNLALIDFAAMKTLQNGGAVFTLSQTEMPTTSPVAAVFRY